MLNCLIIYLNFHSFIDTFISSFSFFTKIKFLFQKIFFNNSGIGLGTKLTCLSASLIPLNNIPLFHLLRGWNIGIIIELQ